VPLSLWDIQVKALSFFEDLTENSGKGSSVEIFCERGGFVVFRPGTTSTTLRFKVKQQVLIMLVQQMSSLKSWPISLRRVDIIPGKLLMRMRQDFFGKDTFQN
jgi:hypothetical protein